MTRLAALLSRLVCLALLAGVFIAGSPRLTHAAAAPRCANPGWFPAGFGLKDHSIFRYDGSYYLISIFHSYASPPGEDRFVYARSADLCVWEQLGDVLILRTPGAADEFRIWAPFVYSEAGVYYLFYTGVTDDYTQRILLATSTNPADPAAWQPQGVVFQPAHPGMVWQEGQWSDCRDATVVKVGAAYMMYYTGWDTAGGIIGVATAATPLGPWRDWGALLPPSPNSILESPTLAHYGGSYYLFYHLAGSPGGTYRIGPAANGPWSSPYSLRPGWAHEIWQGDGGEWYTSYLTGYNVTISPLSWNHLPGHRLPLPSLDPLYPQLLPLIQRRFY